MVRRTLLLIVLAFLVASGGCLGFTADSPEATTTRTSETGATTATSDSPGTSRHPNVVSVRASPRANESHNVTIRLWPEGATAFNRTVVVEPGDRFDVVREHDSYRVTVVVDGEVILDSFTARSYEAVRVEIDANDEVSIALSQV